MAKGLFITLEGGDGVGKTTQANLLEAGFSARGREVVRTREPGGTELGNRIRDMVLHSTSPIDPRAEALLYAADRAQHISEVVRPALERGAMVIQDRYLDSSIAYQGVARGLGEDVIRDTSLWAAQGVMPDLTILLDLDVAAGRERLIEAAKTLDRLESEAAAFHERVRRAFLDLAEREPHRILVIDASLSIREIQARIWMKIDELLERS